MKCFNIKNQRGSGMLLAFFTMMLLFTFGIMFLSAGSSSLMASKRDVLRARALACAEAGVDKGIQMLMAPGPDGQPGSYRTYHPSSNPDNHNGDTWYHNSIVPNEDFYVCVRNGTGINAGKVVITSKGVVTDSGATCTRTVKVVVRFAKENVNVWNNVIFGGVGQSGKSINGNVVMRGSIHLLGDGEDYTDVDGDGHWDDAEPYTDLNHNGRYDLGEPYIVVDGDGHRDAQAPFVDVNGNGTRDPALTVTDMAEEISGTANVGNNYDGMPSDLRALLPALPQVTWNGRTVDSLSAKLRVKHGKVNISGSATVGDPDVSGSTTKQTMDGTYVSDGFGGNKGTSSVYSDNGCSNGYDLGDGIVDMPVIDNGSVTVDGTIYSTYLNYLSQNALVYNGDLNINNGTAMTISGPKGSISIDSSGNMTISGIVYVTGDISFGPGKSRIIYQGNGTLVTPNSTDVHCDLVPKTNFPHNDTLGLICGDKINLATGSGDAHLTMAIAMYAQHKIVCAKQSDIAGTIVASYYEMSNVPRIYQVPDLATHLPPGMPGAAPIWIGTISIQSWQEVANP